MTNNEIDQAITYSMQIADEHMNAQEQNEKARKFKANNAIMKKNPLCLLMIPTLYEFANENFVKLTATACQSFIKQMNGDEYMGWRLAFAARFLQMQYHNKSVTEAEVIKQLAFLPFWLLGDKSVWAFINLQHLDDKCESEYQAFLIGQEKGSLAKEIIRNPETRSTFKI